MTVQLGLPLRVGPLARATDPTTSHVAAASMGQGAARHRAMILYELQRDRRPRTYAEIADACGLEKHQVARRLPELLDEGVVRRLAAMRDTPSKRPAHLWEAV